MHRFIAAIWLTMSASALADPVELPLLPDGSVDREAVSLSVSGPRFADGTRRLTQGTLQGQPFQLSYDYPGPGLSFDLTTTVETLTPDAASMLTVWVLDAICLQQNRVAGPVLWDRGQRLSDGWRVTVSCLDLSPGPAIALPSP